MGGDVEIVSQLIELSSTAGNERATDTSSPASASTVPHYPLVLGIVIVSQEFLQ